MERSFPRCASRVSKVLDRCSLNLATSVWDRSAMLGKQLDDVSTEVKLEVTQESNELAKVKKAAIQCKMTQLSAL